MEFLNIDDDNVNTILELFNKSRDKEGFVIEKRTGKKIECPYTKRFIHYKNFSILPGSATFVNNEIYSFAEHFVRHNSK